MRSSDSISSLRDEDNPLSNRTIKTDGLEVQVKRCDSRIYSACRGFENVHTQDTMHSGTALAGISHKPLYRHLDTK
jgi:hypothetical protein